MLAVDPTEVKRRQREVELMGAMELEACRRNCVYWLERYAWTVDEHLKVDNERKLTHGEPWIDPVTLLPSRELTGSTDDYLLYLASLWWNEDKLAVPKSRQLRITHLMVNLHGWLAMFFPGQRICIQSKKYEDANATLERLHKSFGIMRKMAPHVPWPRHVRKDGRILLPNGSLMLAAAQGADVVRQYTFSAIFSDETAFQPEAEAAYVAALPTVQGGGKYTAVSSADTGFFEHLVFDNLQDQTR